MKKKILLARPNMFLVNEMKDFLTVCGYEPTPIENLSDLDQHNSLEIGGMVISTAIASTVKED